jgi:hypothetical protein
MGQKPDRRPAGISPGASGPAVNHRIGTQRPPLGDPVKGGVGLFEKILKSGEGRLRPGIAKGRGPGPGGVYADSLTEMRYTFHIVDTTTNRRFCQPCPAPGATSYEEPAGYDRKISDISHDISIDISVKVKGRRAWSLDAGFHFVFTKLDFFTILNYSNIYRNGGEVMPTTKVVRKVDRRTAKKPAPKMPKKVTTAERWENIERGFERIQKHIDEVTAQNQEFQKMIRETQEAQREAQEAQREAHREAHREVQEAIKKTQEAHRETEATLNRAIGGLSNTVGSLIEHIMTPGLPCKFRQFGFTFDRITTVKWADGVGNIYTEIDGLLENGSQAMVVEVKTTLRRADIDDHLERMGRVRTYADAHGDKREFLGAIAAAITGKDAKEYALSKGFFVIEPLGEDIKITKPVSDPKVW